MDRPVEDEDKAEMSAEPEQTKSAQTAEERRTQDMRLLEAILFATAEPLSMNAMRERLPDDCDLGGMLMDLQKFYEKRGVHLMEMNGCWAFRTAVDLQDALSVHKEVQRKLSRAAMETLSIVAYHQPVTRAEIENIRGVATSKGTLDVLLEAGWVKPGRRRETPGRPLTWVTTTEFLDQFGLESMNDLPGMDELKASGLLDRRPAIDTVRLTGELFGADEALEDEMEDAASSAEADNGDEENREEALASHDEIDNTDDDSYNEDTEEEERA